MDFGQIIKRAWEITWRYRYLWVLGLLAGVTGAGGGGGGNGFSSGRSFGSNSSSGSSSSPFSAGALQNFTAQAVRWIPILVALLLIWVALAILWWVFSVAARGGLVWAVNELEEGRRPRLGEAWSRGFSHFWGVFVLGILLQLPMFVAVVALIVVIGLPIALAVARGGRFAIAAILPVCGSLLIGIPLLLILGFVLGIMYVIALRGIVLGGQGATRAAGDAYRMFRSRFKDTAVAFLINWGLNIAAGIVIAIPIVLLTLGVAVPFVFAVVAQRWGLVAVIAAGYLLVVMVVSFAFRAIWGTFTSSFWTLAYRKLTGRQQVLSRPGYIPPQWSAAGPPMAPSYPTPGAPGANPAPTPGAPGAYPAPAPAQAPAPAPAPAPEPVPAPAPAPEAPTYPPQPPHPPA